MKRTKKSTSPARLASGKKVGLEYRAPDAKSVCVAGTFNNWQTDATPMKPQPDGLWTIELELPPGTYEYRFVVDGVWCDDPKSAETTPNPFGGFNAVLRVSASI
ncbi:MAG: glycogen-binding domain-containing protein [Verrucomicrobiia bacterium]